MKETRVIINADDCGINQAVDAAIERFILLNKITSTTVMANMDDLAGAKRLYDLYSDVISFGVHVNLTDGPSITKSQQLLDYGFLKEEGGITLLNGYPFIHSRIPKRLHEDIIKECVAQINRVRDEGIEVSHIDSHHLMLTSLSMVSITPQVLEKVGIKTMRRARNYMKSSSLSYFARQLWYGYMKLKTPGLRCVDWFDMFESYYNLTNNGLVKEGTIELMTHPGGSYPQEDELILSLDYSSFFTSAQLINYNQL